MTPQTKQYIIIGVVGVSLIGIGYYALTRKENSGGSEDPTGNGTNTPTTNHFNAKNVADTLLDAMKESGTDEDAIISVLKFVSPIQFTAVKLAFGKQQYNSIAGNQYNYNPFTQLPYFDLKGWLKSELSSQEYGILRNKYPKDL